VQEISFAAATSQQSMPATIAAMQRSRAENGDHEIMALNPKAIEC
jgi:hypothetical protein